VTVPAAAARSASASAARSSSASACSTSVSARRSGARRGPARSSSGHARLALEDRQLLETAEGVNCSASGDRGDRPAGGELAQEADAAEVEHSKER
jgi:hypothetical protein